MVQIIKASEFIKTRKENEEKWSSVFVVGGIKVVVMVFDFCAKSQHEVFVVVKENKEECVVYIPEMLIREREDAYSIVQEALRVVF